MGGTVGVFELKLATSVGENVGNLVGATVGSLQRQGVITAQPSFVQLPLFLPPTLNLRVATLSLRLYK